MDRVLLVDSGDRRETVRGILESAGITVDEPDCVEAVRQIDAGQYRCLLATVGPLFGTAEDAIDLAGRLPVVLIDSVGDARQAVMAMKRGATDYLISPFTQAELIAAVRGCGPVAPGYAPDPLNMVGASEPMKDLYNRIAQVGPTDSTVLIEGESGSGKELVARAIHAASRRNEAPLITLNCATVPAELIESELFGRPAEEQKAERHGLLEAANGGTLFLDEIAELPAKVQARLLRVLHDGSLGLSSDGTPITVDVRIIAATHQSLKQLIEADQFRDDLYYRLNVVNLPIPPLRARGDDVLQLAESILTRTCKRLSKTCPGFTQSAQEAMQHYTWPGNVRELENAVERAVILCSESAIEPHLLAIDLAPPAPAEPPPSIDDRSSLEDYFVRFVTAHQDQLTETELAEKLGISRKSLWERRQRLNIPRKKTRKRGPRRDSP
ncbi:MAG: AAA domain-containing protein [Pseudomonadales bacterium]|nr:sigma-54-dependent Fis family transcriptional regulator [Pseudomonadales bacterium]NIX09360.1 AAA domain-containing protein [Pseudomonadales bacterium]